MLGEKIRNFKEHIAVCLEVLVPKNNFYRQVEAKLDLHFVRDLVQAHYASRMGRPSIDPVVFFKLQLIMFFEGIRSERQLMEMVNMRLDHRWYIGYDLNEKVPDHSSLSKIRERYGLAVFHRFFEKIVELCIAADLVWGKELYFDGTKVQANADLGKLVPRWYWQAKNHLDELFQHPQLDTDAKPQIDPPQARKPHTGLTNLVEKYDGTRILGQRRPWYNRTSDSKVSPTDPSATPMKRFTGDSSRLGYHTHYTVDGGKARIILAVLVTPASIMDNTPMLDLQRWARFRWKLKLKIAVGDARYGTIPNIVGLEQDGIRAYVPVSSQSRSNTYFSLEDFHYDSHNNVYICPQGNDIPFAYRSESKQYFIYRAHAEVCNVCPLKSKCTSNKKGRTLFRSFFANYVDRVKGYHETEAYQKAMRKRQVWVEPLFGEGKQWHGLRRFRLRGLEKVNIEAVMIAAGQNLKRLLKARSWQLRPTPAAAPAAFRLPTLQKFLDYFSNSLSFRQIELK